jgi:hypothetical protein
VSSAWKDVFAKLERTGCRPIVIASHPRSGTHLCIDTLRLNFADCASTKRPLQRVDGLYVNLEGEFAAAGRSRPSAVGRILAGVARPLVKTHALLNLAPSDFWKDDLRPDPEFAQWLRRHATFVYPYRDGRDVMLSLHQFMKVFDPEARVSLSQFLRQLIHGVSRVKFWAMHVQSWTSDSSVHHIAMEDLLRGGRSVLPALAEKLSLPWHGGEPVIPPKNGIEFFNRLKRRIIPFPASTSIEAYGPNQRRIPWREAFNDADREFFRREAGDTLIKLGYEDV